MPLPQSLHTSSSAHADSSIPPATFSLVHVHSFCGFTPWSSSPASVCSRCPLAFPTHLIDHCLDSLYSKHLTYLPLSSSHSLLVPLLYPWPLFLPSSSLSCHLLSPQFYHTSYEGACPKSHMGSEGILPVEVWEWLVVVVDDLHYA